MAGGEDILDIQQDRSLKRPERSSTDRRKSLPHKLPKAIPEEDTSDTYLDAESSPEGADQRSPLSAPGMEEANSMVVRTTKRRLFSRRQLSGLKDAFQNNAYPAREDYEKLATSLGMKESSVKQWFQNARAKLRKRGSLTSATKTFYLDRTEPLVQLSPPATAPRVTPYKPVVIQPIPSPPHVRSAVPSPDAPRQTLQPRRLRSPPIEVKKEPITDAPGLAPSASPSEAETPSPRGLSPRSATTTPVSDSAFSTYKTMQQMALPADHPFCNLSHGGSGRRKRRKMEDTPGPRTEAPPSDRARRSPASSTGSASGSEEERFSAPASVPAAIPPTAATLPYYLSQQYMQAMHAHMRQAAQSAVAAAALPGKKSPSPRKTPNITRQASPRDDEAAAGSPDKPLDLSNKRKRSSDQNTPRAPVVSPPTSVCRAGAPPVPHFYQPGAGLYAPGAPFMYPMYPFMQFASPAMPYPSVKGVPGWPTAGQKSPTVATIALPTV